MKVKSYQDLQVWHRSVELSVAIYSVTQLFPQSEIYGLTSQMRRASVSIASNIAEGHGRSDAEFSRYLQIARGSLAELETQLEIARRIGYLDEQKFLQLSEHTDIVGRQLTTFWKRVKHKKG